MSDSITLLDINTQYMLLWMYYPTWEIQIAEWLRHWFLKLFVMLIILYTITNVVAIHGQLLAIAPVTRGFKRVRSCRDPPKRIKVSNFASGFFYYSWDFWKSTLSSHNRLLRWRAPSERCWTTSELFVLSSTGLTKGTSDRFDKFAAPIEGDGGAAFFLLPGFQKLLSHDFRIIINRGTFWRLKQLWSTVWCYFLGKSRSGSFFPKIPNVKFETLSVRTP